MTRTPLALCLALLGACFEPHGSTQAVRSSDCVLCHRGDFEATTEPVHAAPSVGFPTTCADCHRSLGWQPALEGLHPAPGTYTGPDELGQIVNRTFLIDRGAHAGIRCLTCHDLSVTPPAVPPAQRRGATTSCIQCHPDDATQRSEHEGAVSFLGGPYVEYRADIPNFCLTCHPTGEARHHPKNKFPLSGGHNARCTSCHVRAMGPDTGGQNTSCITSGCHSLSREDAEHQQASYRTARSSPPPPLTMSNFCRAGGCHPDGRTR